MGKNVIGILLCLLSQFGLFGQSPYLHHFTVDDGLPSSHVYSVIQDDLGYIWIATDLGIARFDGYQFKTFTQTDGLVSNDIWGFAKDHSGDLWLKTFHKVIHLDMQTEQFKQLKKETPFSKVRDFAFFKEGKAFASTESKAGIKVHRIIGDSIIGPYLKTQIKTGVFLHRDDELNEYFYISTLEDRLGILQKRTDGSEEVSKWVSQERKHYNSEVIRFNDSCMFFDDTKIYLYHPATNQLQSRLLSETFPAHASLYIDIIFKCGEDFVAITDKGIKSFDKNLIANSKYEYLDDYTVNTVYQDKQGNIWICTNSGLYLNTQLTQSSLTQSFGEPDIEITAIAYHEKLDAIIAGTKAGKLFVLKNDGFKEISINTKVVKSRRKIKNILISPDGGLILSGNFGIITLQESDLSLAQINLLPSNDYNLGRNYPLDKFNYHSDFIKSITLTDKGHILAATYTEVVEILDSAGWRYFNRLCPFRSYAVEVDHDGTTWIGTKNGLCSYDEQQGCQNVEQLNLLSYPINDIKVDAANNVWISTEGFGFFRMRRSGDTYSLDSISAFSKIATKSITVDQADNIWVCTNNGVFKLYDIDRNRFAYKIKSLNSMYGLPSNETNGVLIKDSRVYVAGKKGLSILSESPSKQSATAADFHFSEIYVNKVKQPLKEAYYLKAHENNISINYSCLHFQSIGQIKYSYQLEGMDKSWSTTTDTKKEFLSLPAGNFVFKIKSFDLEGELLTEAELAFFVAKPWWNTNGFKLLSLFLLSIIGYYLFGWYLEKGKNKITAGTQNREENGRIGIGSFAIANESPFHIQCPAVNQEFPS